MKIIWFQGNSEVFTAENRHSKQANIRWFLKSIDFILSINKQISARQSGMRISMYYCIPFLKRSYRHVW